MIRSISLTAEQIGRLRDHARAGEPDEAAAFLYGSIEDGRATVGGMFLAGGSKNTPASFAVTEEDLIEAYRRAERQGTEIVGIFHSHPASEAVPSDTDIRFMRANPVAWIIYSGQDGGIGAFVLDGQVRRIDVAVSENPGSD